MTENGLRWIFSLIATCVFIATILIEMPTVSAAESDDDDDDEGFDLFFETSEETITDLKIDFEKPLEDWIRGSYIRTGPGQFEKGSRRFRHLFDGFAKLYSWNFDSDERNSASFATSFLQTDFFSHSEKLNDISPYLLFESTDPPFNFLQRTQSLLNGIDNTNINILKVGLNTSCFMAVSDFWHSYEFDPFSLETISRIDPELPLDNVWTRYKLIPIPSTAHPVPENLDLSSYINIYTLSSPFPDLFQGSVNIVRIKSGTERQLIASIPMNRVPYMHSIGLSKNYAIIIAHPLFIDVLKILVTGEPVSSLDWEPQFDMDVYLVHLGSGAVRKLTTPPEFVTHVINAFEESDQDKLYVDLITYPTPDIFKDLNLKNLRDPVLRNKIRADALLKRYVIDISRNSISVETFNSTPGFEFVNRLDMPVINEEFRFSNYCFVYGVVMKSDGDSLANVTLAKKDLCRKGSSGVEDRAWYVRGHYPAEPWFIPRPNGKSEDDGMLISVVMDGRKRRSYLAILDATTMTLINRSYLPIVVPYTLHGRHFDHIRN